MDKSKVISELKTLFTDLQYCIREKRLDKGVILQSRYSTLRAFCMDCDIMSFMEMETLEYECFQRMDKIETTNQTLMK